MAEIKKISTELQLLDKFLDTSGDAGTSGQVLTSTGTGINWVSGGSLPGGPYLPLAGGTLTSTTSPILILNPTANNYGGIQFNYGGAVKGAAMYNSGFMVFGGETGTHTRLQAGGQYAMHINSSTRNVHIGSTTDATYKLQVTGTFYSGGNATFGGKILVGTGATAAASINSYSTTVSTGLYSALRVIEHGTASSYWDIGATNAANTLLNFYHNGNTTPKIFFTHTGGATFAGDVTTSLRLKSTGADTQTNTTASSDLGIALQNTSDTDGNFIPIDFFNSTGFVTARIGAEFQDAGDRNTDLYFCTRANSGSLTERMRITSGGNVGIGTTNPNDKLNIHSPSDSGNIGLKITRGAQTHGLRLGVNSSHAFLWTTENQDLVFATNNGQRLTIQAGGNVGIGTTNPSAPLHVVGNSYVQNGTFYTDAITAYSGTSININAGSSYFNLTVNSAERMRVTSTGNVGIGTTSPGYKLEVVGNGYFTTALRVDGSINFYDDLIGTSYKQGTTAIKNKRIKNIVLESSIETNTAVIHPYFNNNLGNFIAKGGTITFGNVTTPPNLSQQNLMFQPNQNFMGLSASNITASTWSMTLTSTNSGQMNFNYGCWIGITFGSTSFDPDSCKIEVNTNADGSGTWITALNSTVSDTGYFTYYASGGTGIKSIRFTMGQTSQGPRVCNIYAYNYAAEGMNEFFLSKAGGSVFGDIIPGTNYLSGGTYFPKLGGTGNRWNEAYINKIADINNSFGTSGQVLSSNASGQLDWVSGGSLPGGPYLPLAGGTMTGTNGVVFPDAFKLNLGTGSDLQIYHDSANSYIETSASSVGDLYIKAQGTNHDLYLQAVDNVYIRPQGGENGIIVVGNGAVELYYDNVRKFQTTSTGVNITGGVNANGTVSTFGAAGTGDGDAVVSIDGGSGTNGEAYLRLTRGGTSGFILNHTAGNIQIRATANIPMYFYTNGSIRQTIAADGKVGIGTTSPDSLLHVSADVTGANTGTITIEGRPTGFLGDDIATIDFHNNGSKRADIRMERGNAADDSQLVFSTSDTGTLNDALIINEIGNVGIGTTSPDSKLDVKGPSATPADGNQTLSITNTTGGTQLNIGTAENSYGWIEAREGATLRNLLLNPNGGNVGIGTTSPLGKLMVREDSAGNPTRLIVSNGGTVQSGTTARLSFYEGISEKGYIERRRDGSGKMAFYTPADDNPFVWENPSGEIMRITNSKVGIGMTSPAEKLSLPDNAKIGLGNSADLQIYHNATNSVISNSTGHLYIKTTVADKDIIFEASNGAGSVESYLEIDSDQQDIKVNKRIEMTGTGSAGGQHTIEFNPGTSAIGYIYHDDTNFNVRAIKASSDLVLEATHGNVQILNGNGSGTEVGVMIEQYIAHIGDTDTKFGFTAANQFQVIAGGNTNLNVQGNGVDLSYAGSTRLTTQTGGIAITGDLTVTADVGIGLTNPDVPLHVTANEDGSGIDKGAAKFINTNTGQGATTMHMVQTSSSNFANAVKFWQGSTPTAVGFIRLTTSATQFITSASDLNLKKNITNWSDDTLSKFKALEPKKFRFKTQDVSEDKTLGFIAQNEVDNFPEAYPQFLGDDEQPYYGFNPTGMVPHLMKAIKDLVEKVEILENKITQLENNN